MAGWIVNREGNFDEYADEDMCVALDRATSGVATARAENTGLLLSPEKSHASHESTRTRTRFAPASSELSMSSLKETPTSRSRSSAANRPLGLAPALMRYRPWEAGGCC